VQNSDAHANKWLRLVAEQPLPVEGVFRTHVAAGQIASLCSCGCHGFGFNVPPGRLLRRLTTESGLYCELAFRSNMAEEINVLLFADDRGYFSAAKVTYGANLEPMPDAIDVTALVGVWPSNVVATPPNTSLERTRDR
jgi:hypothetical protein